LKCWFLVDSKEIAMWTAIALGLLLGCVVACVLGAVAIRAAFKPGGKWEMTDDRLGAEREERARAAGKDGSGGVWFL
jgi:hypothetical protein